MKKDYSSLINFILDDPRNELTDNARSLLEEISERLAFPVLKTKPPKDFLEDISDEVREDYVRMLDNYHRDSNPYHWDGY